MIYVYSVSRKKRPVASSMIYVHSVTKLIINAFTNESSHSFRSTASTTTAMR